MNANQGLSARKIANDFSHLRSRSAQVPPGEVYQRYLLAVRQLAKAAGASLLVEPKADQHRPLLIHEGIALLKYALGSADCRRSEPQ